MLHGNSRWDIGIRAAGPFLATVTARLRDRLLVQIH